MSSKKTNTKKKKSNKKTAATQYLDLEAKRHKGREYESDGENQDEYEDDGGFTVDDINKEIVIDKKGKKIKKSGYYLKANANALKEASKEDKREREIKIMLLMEGMKHSRKLATNAYIAGCKSVDELLEKEAKINAEDSDDSGESEDEDEAEDSSNEIIDVDPIAVAKAEKEEKEEKDCHESYDDYVMYQGKPTQKYFLMKILNQISAKERVFTPAEIDEVIKALDSPVVENGINTNSTSSSSSSSDNRDEIEISSSSDEEEEEESIDEGDAHREADALKDQEEDETIEELLEQKRAAEARRVLDSDSESAQDHGNTNIYSTNDSSDEDDGKLKFGYNGSKKVKNQPFDPEKAIYKQDGNFDFKSKYYKITYFSTTPIPNDLSTLTVHNYSTARIESGAMAGQYATFIFKDGQPPFYVPAKKGMEYERKFPIEQQRTRMELAKNMNNIYGTDVVPDPTQTRCIVACALFESKKKKWEGNKQTTNSFAAQINAASASSKIVNKKTKKIKSKNITTTPLTLVPVPPPPAPIQIPITGKPATIELKKPEAKRELIPYKHSADRPTPMVQQQLMLIKKPSNGANIIIPPQPKPELTRFQMPQSSQVAPAPIPAPAPLSIQTNQMIDVNGKVCCAQCCGQPLDLNRNILKRKFDNLQNAFALDSDPVDSKDGTSQFTRNSVQSILLKSYNNYLNASGNQNLKNEIADIKNTWDACYDYLQTKKTGSTYGYVRTITGPKILTQLIKHLPFFDPEARNLLFERMKKQKG